MGLASLNDNPLNSVPLNGPGGEPVIEDLPATTPAICVPREDRVFRVAPEDQVFELHCEDREFYIPPENTVFKVPPRSGCPC